MVMKNLFVAFYSPNKVQNESEVLQENVVSEP